MYASSSALDSESSKTASMSYDTNFINDRRIDGIERRAGSSSIGSELVILSLLVVSGVVGLVTNNVIITTTMFIGGLSTWLFLTLPEYLALKIQSKLQMTALQNKALRTAAVPPSDSGTPAVAAPPLPSPESVMSLIKGRRSVYPKDYSGAEVPREHLERMLEAANWAPTHGLTEPWRFVVLAGESKKGLEDLTMELCRTRLPEDKAVKTLEKLNRKRETTWGKISCYIAICCKRQAKPDKLMPEWEEMAAVACAVQNMALMATSLGLGAYWSSWYEVAREAPEMKSLLGCSPEDRVLGFFTVGCCKPERLAGYRGGRGPWADKVTWRG